MMWFRRRSIRFAAAFLLFFALPFGLVLAEKYVLPQKPGAMYEFAHHRRSSTMAEGFILTHFLYFVLTMSCVLAVCVLAFCAPEHPEMIREMGRNTKEAYVLHATFFLPSIAALDLSSFLKAYNPITIIHHLYFGFSCVDVDRIGLFQTHL